MRQAATNEAADKPHSTANKKKQLLARRQKRKTNQRKFVRKQRERALSCFELASPGLAPEENQPRRSKASIVRVHQSHVFARGWTSKRTSKASTSYNITILR